MNFVLPLYPVLFANSQLPKANSVEKCPSISDFNAMGFEFQIF